MEEDDEADFYISLSHKVRRTIIKIIGTNKTASFTEIKRATNLSTGVVYHHLDQLSKLIQRDEKKRYSLTKMGEHAFRFMDVNLDSIEAKKFEENVDEDKNTIPFYRYVSSNPILEKTKTKPIYQISVCLAIMVIILLLNGYSGLNCYLFFFVERKIYDPEWLPYLSPVLSYVFAGLISEFIIRVLFKKKENTREFLLMLPFSYIPSIMYLIFYNIFNSFIHSAELHVLDTIVMIVFQIWSLAILVNVYIRSKSIKLERAIFTAIVLVYFSFTALLFTLVPIL